MIHRRMQMATHYLVLGGVTRNYATRLQAPFKAVSWFKGPKQEEEEEKR